ILVQHSLVRVTRQRIEIEVVLLDVLAVIAFARHQAEIALFENRIALVPERHRPAEDLVSIAEAGDAVLSPAIGLRSGKVWGEERPGVAVLAVVLAHRSPCAVRQIGTPLVPAGALMGVAGESLLLGVHRTSVA